LVNFFKLKFNKNSSVFKFYSHVLNYGIGNVLPQVIGFFLIPLYIRYLTPADYGILEIAGSISSFCIGLMHLKIPGALTRYYYEYNKNPDQLADYITTVHRLVNMVSVISSVFILSVLFFIQDYVFKGLDYWPFTVLAVLTAALSANSQLQQRLLQNNEQSKYSAILRTVFSLINIILAIFFVALLKWGPAGILFSSFIVTVAFYIQAEFYLKQYLTGSYQTKMAKQSLSYGLALAPSYVVGDVAILMNKSLLLKYGALEAVGIYSMASRFFMPLDLLAEATNTAFVPLYNKLRKEDRTLQLIHNVRKTLIINILLFGFFLLGMPFIMKLMLTREYLGAILLFPIIGLSFIGKTIYHICIAEVFYSIRTKYMFIIVSGNILVNTGLCVLLAEEYKALGVCIAYASGSLAMGAMAFIYKSNISNFYSFKSELSLYFVAAFAISALSYLIYN